MTERELTLAAWNTAEAGSDANRGTTADLVRLLDEADPADPSLAELDIDVITRHVEPADLDDKEFARLISALARLQRAGAPVQLAQLSPQTFASLMAKVKRGQLAEVFSRPELRSLILDEIFRRMGTHLKPERSANVYAVVHWRFSGGSGDGGYDRYETIIDHGSCSASTERSSDARATITLGPVDFVQLIIGKSSPPLLFMTGKLKVKGDLAFAAGMMTLFDLPRP